jgi:formylglycine-generating enzyme required for sulfatase activity
MGSTNGDVHERPVHQVTINYSFYIGKYEVTQAQWQAVMGDNLSYFKGDNLPVEEVSQQEAITFCKRLSQMNGMEYRLPTEAEWEYACRAGTTGDYAGELDAMAWHSSNSGGKTHPVGQKQANAFGLYDMYGNVWEWCLDYYHSNYIAAPTDGSAWVGGSVLASAEWNSNPVLRGGAWDSSANNLRSPFRNRYDWIHGFDRIGFRVVAVARTQ